MNAATQVRERPVLFSGPMVRAILGGTKTQTRRVVKPQPEGEPRRVEDWARAIVPHCGRDRTEAEIAAKAEQLRGAGLFPFAGPRGLYSPSCPYGQPGDRLWVREAWRPIRFQGGTGMYDGTISQHIEFRAHEGHFLHLKCVRASSGLSYVGEPEGYWRIFDRAGSWDDRDRGRWRPSIHMPRWASRLTLEITDVRVERVQEISPEDCRAEGVWVQRFEYRAGELSPYCPMSEERATEMECAAWGAEKLALGVMDSTEDAALLRAFRKLWGSLNAPRGYGWDANPWVWVVSFRRIDR